MSGDRTAQLKLEATPELNLAGRSDDIPRTGPELAARIAGMVPLHLLKDPTKLEEVAARWCERQRCWHGPAHLLDLLTRIGEHARPSHREVLQLAALYHDAVYDPRADDNEEASARLLIRHTGKEGGPVAAMAAELVRASRWAEKPANAVVSEFFELDTRQLAEGCPISERLAYERAVFREYQWVPWQTYREKRADFLRQWARRFPQHARGVAECLELLAGLNPRIAVYPGSFNPFHRGHLSVLRQAEAAFDKVIVAVGVNRQKPGAEESVQARHEHLAAQLRYHEVAVFDGLLPTYLNELDTPVTVVRGVRDGTDLEAELRYARFLDELRPGTSVVWLACAPQFQHVSSSALRELAAIEPGAEERYLPAAEDIYGLCAK